jgi:hypothetical protein
MDVNRILVHLVFKLVLINGDLIFELRIEMVSKILIIFNQIGMVINNFLVKLVNFIINISKEFNLFLHFIKILVSYISVVIKLVFNLLFFVFH